MRSLGHTACYRARRVYHQAMATQRCPNCKLVNPGSAQSCDCGYSFATGHIGTPLDLSKPHATEGPVGPPPGIGHRFFAALLVALVVVAIRLLINQLRH